MTVSVKFCSRNEFIHEAMTETLPKESLLISINDTEEEQREINNILSANGYHGVVSSVFKDDEESFTRKEAEPIVDFIELEYNSGTRHFVVHCFAGISRSAAVAKFIHDYYVGDSIIMDYYTIHNKRVYRVLEETYHRLKYGMTQSWSEHE